MPNKKLNRFIAALLAVFTLSFCFKYILKDYTAEAVTQNQINSLKDQAKELERQKKDLQSQINDLKYDQASVLAKKTVIDQQINVTQEQMTNLNEQIEVYTQYIADKEIEVTQLEQAEQQQWDKFKIRIRAMEENGAIAYVSVLLNATSYEDLLTRVADVGEIMQSDEALYRRLVQTKEETIQAKEDLESAIADQQSQVVLLESKQTELEDQQSQSDELLAQIEGNLDTYNQLYDKIDKESDQVQKEINAKVAELERQQSAANAVAGSGTFIWPTPSSYRVTSPFGKRYHPIYHTYRMHTGIDIGAKYGTNIVAADGGTVITSTYSSSYGNYVVISHGNGITTLYAHMSARLVKVGNSVSQGEVIGRIGSTGASTGPHLHFEISINGSRVDPLNYFSGYTKSY